MSGVLAIIGNPRGDGLSESEAWASVERMCRAVIAAADSEIHGEPRTQRSAFAYGVQDTMEQIIGLARAMRRQVKQGVHVNPHRNPAGVCMSENVQAIVYRHKKDGECYIHAFGNGKVTKRDLDLLSRMSCLKDRTQVQMIAEPDGSVSVVGANGQPLWKEF